MMDRKLITGGIRRLRDVARKANDAPQDVEASLAELLGMEREAISRIIAGNGTLPDFMAAAEGFETLAAQMDEATAVKSFGSAWYEDTDLDRDALGKRIHKPLGSSPGELQRRRADELRDLDRGNERDAYGRSVRKVYS